MSIIERRRRQKDRVASAYADLSCLLQGDFGPGFINRTEVLEAERNGLPVLDGLLGYILNGNHPPENRENVDALFGAVGDAIVREEVVNRCHNLQGAVALMLDAIGCPAIMIWGSVNASSRGTRGFALNANIPPESRDHRPGHSWILTPYGFVNDVALVHGDEVGDDYDLLAPSIPKLVQIPAYETSEPEKSWWRLPSPQTYLINDAAYAQSTQYHNLLGWSQCVSEDLTIRYLPAAVTLPEESDLNDVNIRIGGMRPGEFLSNYLTR